MALISAHRYLEQYQEKGMRLPVFGFEFADDSDIDKNQNDKKSVGERIEALRQSDPESYAAIFGKGVSKGSKEVTDAKVSVLNDEQKQRYFDTLKRERVDRTLTERAKAFGFHNPEDAKDFLSNQLTLSEDLEVCTIDGSEVTSIDDALKELAKRSPHLVKAAPQRPGTGSQRPPITTDNMNNTDKPTFKRSQLRDSAFYLQHEKEILEAARDGRIVDDL